MGKILIYGGCVGWYVQIVIIIKDIFGIEKFLGEINIEGVEKDFGNLIFVLMLIVVLEFFEFCKLILV